MQDSSPLEKLSHTDKKISSLINELGEINIESSYYLMIVAGPYEAGRKNVLSRVEKKIGSFTVIDLREVIMLDEEACFKKIDELFSNIGETEKNLLFRHGDVLAGEYTGFTYSDTRYATPQEKYLLKKINSSEKFVIMELEELENIDKTLGRYAQAAIICDKPASAMGKFLWRLKQVKVNGHTFTNKRPKTEGFKVQGSRFHNLRP